MAFSIFAEIEPGVVIWTSARWTVLLDFDILRFLVAAYCIAAEGVVANAVVANGIAVNSATQRIDLRSETSG